MSIAAFMVAVLSFNILSAQENSISIASDTLKKTSPAIIAPTKAQLKIREKAERDSLKLIKDSIRAAKPRILESYIIPDSLKYKRIILWNYDSHFNRITGMLKQDTTFDGNFHFLPFMKKDVGATYLGVSGSAAQSLNYFLREKSDFFTAFDPYIPYSYTKETHPFYNVKTPHTELAYRGTILAERAKEESNIRFMTTQNISPELNITILYERYGGKGILNKESTDDRTFSLTSNYLGKRYVVHAGYIFQSVKREENGGVTDDTMVLDTTINPRAIDYNLKTAYNRLKRNSLFFTHSYAIPIRLSKKDTLNNSRGTVAYI
ncbi:MAG: putative porin, partial [Bacteroidales bacterium]|nr:putative porin [Bacteroidales bacterium]